MQQTITFSTADQPLRPAGVWKMTACQQVGQQTLADSFTFVEQGARYTLPNNSVYEQFPPPQQQGDFSHVLPHLLLRGLAGAGSLCLLLLTQEDGFSIRQGTLGDFSALPDGWYAPPLQPMPALGEDEQTPCTQLLLPWSSLQAAMPSAQDLPYLSHLRRVATVQQKAARTLEDGTVLCLFCHRAPTPCAEGRQMTVCLVSLEGVDQWQGIAADATIQLPLLHWWQFCQQQGSLDFGTLAAALSGGYLGARQSKLPLLQQGYLPLQHHLRNGETTVSWYRGPLTPVAIAPRPLPENSDLADAYTCYDPATGMLDVSRSAAWQVGHLLALRSGDFVAKLQRLRTQRRRTVLLGQERQRLQARWGAAGIDAARQHWADRLDSLCADCLTAAPARTVPRILPHSDRFFWVQCGDVGLDLQVEAEGWLDSLGLLKEVPFEYLVPQEEMLPPESLRLFYLDANWLDALRQGALAVGRQGSGDRCHDEVWFDRDARPQDTLPRGFLLRSQMVTLWQGMEVHGYTDPDAKMPCQVLRLERLGADVMIGIFKEGIARLEFLEPPESLHLSCLEQRLLRDPLTAQPTQQRFALCLRQDGSIDFAKTAAAYPVEGQPMSPDLLAMQLLQTAQTFIVRIREE